MKKFVIIWLVLALSLTLWACNQNPTEPAGQGSTPGTSATTQPTSPTDPTQPAQSGMAMPQRRPAHSLGSFEEIEGWYLFEYAQGSFYPTKVTMVDMEENPTSTFTLEFDENGLPVKMLHQETGSEETTEVKLNCDQQGFITEAIAYDGEGQVSVTYLMTYNEDGRMVTTTMRMDDGDMVMHYDELYRIILIEVSGEDVETVKAELAYDDIYDEYFVTKLLVRDQEGNIVTGFENFYGENGGLAEQVMYSAGEIWYRGTYNEKGQLVTEWIMEEDFWSGETYEILETHEYDDQDRVIKTTTQENGQYTGYMTMSYSGTGCTYKHYDADNVLMDMYYEERDAEDNLVKRTTYDEKEKVIESWEWEYDAEGRCLKEFVYGADGKLQWGYTYTYDARGNLVKQEEHDHTGVITSCDRVFDEEDNLQQETERYADGSYTVRDYLPRDGYAAVYREMRYDAEGTRIYGWEDILDENNHVIKNVYYQEDGSRSETTYNEDHNPLLYIWYDANGVEVERRENSYHENGELAQETFYADGVLASVYTYDDYGSMLTYKEYDADGNVVYQEKNTYTYYDDGMVKTRTVYNQNVKPVLLYQYDQLGELEREIYYTATGDTNVRIDYAYVYGNGARKVTRSYYNNKGTLICTVEYNEVMDWFDWKLQDVTVIYAGMFQVYQKNFANSGTEAYIRDEFSVDENGFYVDYRMCINEVVFWEEYTVYQIFEDGTSQLDVYDENGKLTRRILYNNSGHPVSDESFE